MAHLGQRMEPIFRPIRKHLDPGWPGAGASSAPRSVRFSALSSRRRKSAPDPLFFNFYATAVKAKKQVPLKNLIGQSAQDLFPDLFQNESAPKKVRDIVVPPPPDTNWLANILPGAQQERAEDAPLALLAMGGDSQRNMVEQQLATMGYAVTTATSSAQAINQLRAKNYHLILCATNAAFEPARQFVHQLAVERRRKTYFVLIGPDMHTLYDLEALAFSANLVINVRDLASLKQILDKGFRDYERLFRPLLDTLRTARFHD